MTDIETAARQAENLARAEAILGEPLNPPDAGNHTPETTSELIETAKRALLRRLAEMAENDATGIENVAEALRAIEFA